MNIRIRSLLIAVVVGVIFVGASQIIYISLTNIGTLTSGQVQPSNVSPLATALSCLCVPLIEIGLGLLYAFLHSREAALSAVAAGLGGALAGFSSSLISVLLGLCVTLVAIPLALGQQPNALLANPAATAVGVAFAACLTPFFYAVVSGIGGLIGAAIWGRNPRPAAAAA